MLGSDKVTVVTLSVMTAQSFTQFPRKSGAEAATQPSSSSTRALESAVDA